MATIDYNATGDIFDIQRFSLNDGPGIRTIVFLKGCPLSCWWCSNPESQRRRPVVLYNEADCIHCRRCEQACRQQAVSFDDEGTRHFDYDSCTGNGDCAAACPAGALIMKGHGMTVRDLIDILKKDRSTFRHSGGGVTLSGGDPFMQADFACELFKACKAQGWNTAIETEGCADTQQVLRTIPYIDTILLDIKHMDPEKHRIFTGVSNELILNNARQMAAFSPLTIRVPVIPKFNNSEAEIGAIAEFAASLPNVMCVHLLPYHSLGENKYKMMGREYKMARLSATSLTNEDLEKYRPIIERAGVPCRIGDGA
ncbi:MAG: glycyl-radical enzyme activating protein [Megasphaera sp.]|jgi:pyruvate formate lyase activating enzyme|nr:glycyl-radical enzyme activating protein [Megasphaera sp.]